MEEEISGDTGLHDGRAHRSWKDKNDIIFISHGDCPEDAQFVADLIKEHFGYENFMIDYIGATIGAHSGPGTVALFYMGDHR